MTRAERFRAYAVPCIVFAYAVIVLIVQALGGPATLTDRIVWLVLLAATAAAWAYQLSMARAYMRLYRSVMDTYEKCAASRDYWMERARATDPVPPGQDCSRCTRPYQPALGGCQHDVCGWCAWCPSCCGPYTFGTRPEVIS